MEVLVVRTLLLALIALFCVANFASFAKADPRKDGPTVVGATWHWIITDAKGKELNGDFRVKDGDVYIGTDKVGSTRAVDNDEVEMIFGGYDDLNGKVRLMKTKTKPATFRGTLNKSDGTKWQMRVIVRDR